MKFLLGKKIGMSQIFDAEGSAVPVTVVQAGPVSVVQVKTKEKDGYDAVQLGFGARKRVSKPVQGHLKPSHAGNVRWLREFRLENQTEPAHARGSRIDVSVFQPGDIVKISGVSKGKGFQGVVKRHGFHGASSTHGTKHAHRQAGSIGSTTPQRVVKGMRMPGRMGHERVTVRNLKIVQVDKEKGLLAVKGAVPGARGTLLEIRG